MRRSHLRVWPLLLFLGSEAPPFDPSLLSVDLPPTSAGAVERLELIHKLTIYVRSLWGLASGHERYHC